VITLGGGALSPANGQVNTGSDGTAQAGWTLGSLIGANTVVVSSGSLTPATFTATVNPASDSQVTALSGAPQTATAGTAFASPLVVKVSTAGGSAVVGAVVNFAVAPAGAATLGALSVPTDASGQAQVTVVAGHTAQAFTVVASVTGVTQTTTFNLTATAGAPALIEKVSGDTQNAAAGTALANPIIVKVSDQYNNPVQNALVTFSVTGGGGSLNPATGQVNTGSDGKAQIAWTVGTVIGANGLNAAVGALTPVTFSATANAPSDAKLVLIDGNNQTGTVGQALARALTLKVTTAGGTPIAGAVVGFTSSPANSGR